MRCQMHFITGRAEERLTFDLQRPVAEQHRLCQAHGGMSAVERFMKRYFLVAKDVGDLTAIVCAALEARHAKPRADAGPLRRPFPPRGQGHRRDAATSCSTTTASASSHEEVFQRDPVNLIRIFWLADRLNRAHPPRRHAARHPLAEARRARSCAANPEANRLFMEILTSKNAPEVVLRRMNEAGVLGRFIPEFGRVVAMMQFNMYHHYTVDEHLIRSIGVLADLENGRLKDELPVANEILPTIRNRTVLAVALFIHDIAKGRPEDHRSAGAQIARKLGPRLGLTRRRRTRWPGWSSTTC